MRYYASTESQICHGVSKHNYRAGLSLMYVFYYLVKVVTTTDKPSLASIGQSNLQRMGQAPLHLRRIQRQSQSPPSQILSHLLTTSWRARSARRPHLCKSENPHRACELFERAQLLFENLTSAAYLQTLSSRKKTARR